LQRFSTEICMLPSIVQGSVSQTLCCRTLECGIDSWGFIRTYTNVKYDHVLGKICGQIGGSTLYFGGPSISMQVGCAAGLSKLLS